MITKKRTNVWSPYFIRQLRVSTPMILALTACSAWAQEPSTTLAHMKESQTINIGFREGVPFSFTDSTGKVTGYTIALCEKIAHQIGKKLGIKNLNIRFVPVSLSDRVTALKSSKIDMDCGVNADTPERIGSVRFTRDYHNADMRFITLRSSGIHTLADLKGKTVSILAGSKDLLEANRINREQHLNLSFRTTVLVKDAFEMMAQHRTAALFLDDVVVFPLINNSPHPTDFNVSQTTIGPKMHYAIMLKNDDPQFLSLIDGLLGEIMSSPLNTQLSKKWLDATSMMPSKK
ncbi:transporter substrate-binding domain-containing protein [Kluyvera sp. CHPC 1.251]|uniref:transporter substrate-binding domain-containing protein n=1 Tax=Kluyvera sp. CHPC 1.251 TaxID=2995175 RepID=UPI002FD7F0CD